MDKDGGKPTKFRFVHLKIVIFGGICEIDCFHLQKLTKSTWSLNGYHGDQTELIFLKPSRILIVPTKISSSKES